jgi:CBS domain-containing protein
MRKKPPSKVADVLEIKGPGATTIKPDETIGALARRLQQERLGAMIVSRDGSTVDGTISERDVAYALALHKSDLHALPVGALMTKNAVTCTPQDSLAEVSRVMAERHIRHLPVVDGDQLVGVIGMRDIFMHRLDEMQRMTKLLGSYVGAGG